MKTNGVKLGFRKIAELGIGAIAIATLILAGCGGGGGGGGGGASTTLSVSPSLGQFQLGTSVQITGATAGQTATGTVNASGVAANINVTGFTAPLLVSVLPDSTGSIHYFDEKSGNIVSASAPAVGAIRALVPNIATAAASGVGVTPLTEMAVGYLVQTGAITSNGTLAASATPALATAAANAVGSIFGMSANEVLSPPAIIGASSVPLTDLTSKSNQYALKLAALANMANGSTNNALTVSQALTQSFQTGTFGTGLANSGVINVPISTTALPTSSFSTALTNSMTTVANNTSLVTSTAATNDLATVVTTVPTAPPANITNLITDTVGGTITGLPQSASVVLQDNGGDNLTITANGTFTFATPITSGSAYNVTVLTQPSTYTCTVSNGAGTISGSNVTTVAVVCAVNTYSVGGSVSGLSGSLVLQDNGGDSLTVSANSSFTFATKVASGSSYSVTVASHPAGQSCSVANGTASTISGNVTNVAVTCSTNTFPIGGTVTGLSGSTNVVLQDNGGDNLTVQTNGTFSFATAVAYGNLYNVTVFTQPTGQTCSVTSGSGTTTGGVTSVVVSCVTSQSTTSAAIASAKTLLSSLGTSSVSLLGSSGSAGFIQNQASAVQADLTASHNTFSEANDFLKFVTNAVGLLRNGNVGTSTPNVTMIYANGQPWPCGSLTTSTSAGKVVCQFEKVNGAGTQISTHQLIITGPIPSSTSTTPTGYSGKYNGNFEISGGYIGGFNMTISSTGTVTGSGTVTCTNAACFTSAPLTGTASMTSGTISFTTSGGDTCTGTISGGSVSGTCNYAITNPATIGTFVATLQPPPSSVTGTYNWTEAIIGTSQGSAYTYTSPNPGATVNGTGAVITLNSTAAPWGIVSSPAYLYTTTPGLTAAGVTAGASGVITISAGTGSTLSFDINGNLTPGNTANVTLVGNALAATTAAGSSAISTYYGLVPLNASGSPMIDHINVNFAGSIAAATVTAGTQDTINLSGTVAKWSIPTPANANGVIVNSITIGSGSKVVMIPGTSTTQSSPVSIALTGMKATTPIYEFDGSLAVTSFGQNMYSYCTNYDPATSYTTCVTGYTVSSPSWYPKQVTFTGSVTDTFHSSVGTFMTTTGTGLVVNMDQSNFNPNSPTSATNYQVDSASFNGKIVNGSSTYSIANLLATNGNTVSTYNPVGTLALTYTDPNNITVTVNLTATTPPSGSAVLGNSSIAIVYNSTTKQGDVYTGYTGSGNPGTKIGYITGGMVYFTDGSNQSLP